jgi:hypothetical protein
MYFDDAIRALSNGKTIRRKLFAERIFAFKDFISRFIEIFTYDDVVADDWEIVEEPKKELSNHLNFGEALELVKAGRRLSRRCWHNENIYIFITDGIYDEPEPFICVKTIRGIRVPWIPNHNELLGNDWYVVDEE